MRAGFSFLLEKIMSDQIWGCVKLSMFVCQGTDEHGRQRGKFVSVLNQPCNRDEAKGIVRDFMELNPHIANVPYRAEFVMRETVFNYR
jgi:hypothetical protein